MICFVFGQPATPDASFSQITIDLTDWLRLANNSAMARMAISGSALHALGGSASPLRGN
jgi:hypothetical protein